MKMKAIWIERPGSYDVLEYKDVDKPEPMAGHVVIKSEWISVNYADIWIRKGKYPWIRLPNVPGLEVSGIVESIGDDVKTVKIGDRVVALGEKCYAEYVLADVSLVFPIPDSVSLDVAAAFPVTYLTAYHMLHTVGNVKQGQSVLIYGAAGGVGTAVIELGKLAGVQVIGLTSSDDKANFAKEKGIDHIINYRNENVVKRVGKITENKGVHLVLDSVDGKTLANDFEVLAPLGLIILFGFGGGLPEIDLNEQFKKDSSKGVGIRVFHLMYSMVYPYPKKFEESFKKLLGYLEKKKIAPSISERLPLSKAKKAHELLESQRNVGKILLQP